MYLYYRSYEQAGLISKENKELDLAVQYMERASFMFQEHGTPDTAALCLEKAAKWDICPYHCLVFSSLKYIKQRNHKNLPHIYAQLKKNPFIDFSLYWIYFLVQLWRKLIAYRNTLESIPGTNMYWAISVKFLAQGNKRLTLTGFEPRQLAILRLLVRHVNHSFTLPPLTFNRYYQCSVLYMIVSHYQNKRLYNILFSGVFWYKFYRFCYYLYTM